MTTFEVRVLRDGNWTKASFDGTLNEREAQAAKAYAKAIEEKPEQVLLVKIVEEVLESYRC